MYLNRDGSHTAVVSAGPTRFRTESGWVDLDLSLVPAPDGSLVAKAAPGAATLGARADTTLATVATAAGPITLHHPGAAGVAGRSQADRATYPRALGGGRDLVLTPTPDGYKEEVVLPDAAAGATYREVFGLPEGVVARDAPAGVEFVDGEGVVVATLGGGIAYDAAFPAAGPAATTPVSVHVVPPEGADALPRTEATDPANAVTVEVSISPDWLAAPDRRFPVTIDPSVFTANAADHFDTYVSTAAPTTSFSTSPFVIVPPPAG